MYDELCCKTHLGVIKQPNVETSAYRNVLVIGTVMSEVSNTHEFLTMFLFKSRDAEQFGYEVLDSEGLPSDYVMHRCVNNTTT